jgi:hypothetical protein
MREREIERRLGRQVKDLGGVSVKLACPGMDGMPDRLVLMPGGKMAFVELKAPGMKPRALQEARHRMLRGLGFRVYVLDDPEMTGEAVDEILRA